MDTQRREVLVRFYSLLDRLNDKIGGARRLADCSGRMIWPKRGVYFVQEQGENRSDTGDGPRIVRVGTHAVRARSRATLWGRLSQHRGSLKTGGGNHRGSIFRLLIGEALIKEEDLVCPMWGVRNAAMADVRRAEADVERRVSQIIRNMRVLWLAIDDESGPGSRRAYVERNSIALLSNYNKPAFDAPSRGWLGRSCSREPIKKSGLWNQDHVEKTCDGRFLDTLDQMVSDLGSPP
jgi:hypothetical protein